MVWANRQARGDIYQGWKELNGEMKVENYMKCAEIGVLFRLGCINFICLEIVGHW